MEFKKLVENARMFAEEAHTGQVRKYTNTPYFEHCEAVASMVKNLWPNSNYEIAIAYLHDTVEDTAVTIADIHDIFGQFVAEGVSWLTDFSTPDVGNRALRKKLERVRLAAAPGFIKTIKICDLIDNSSSIFVYDKNFGRVYAQEKRLLLDEALVQGDPNLWRRASYMVDEFLESLKDDRQE